MQPWEAVVTTVLGAGGGAILLKLGEALFRQTADVAKTALKEHTKQKVKKIELTGDPQKDISRIAEKMYEDQQDAREEISGLHGKLASVETANNALQSSFETMRKQRDLALTENKHFIEEITRLVDQAKDLTSRLAKRELEFQMLSLEHEGAKARIDKLLETIAEMRQFIDDMNAERARLESELERAKVRG